MKKSVKILWCGVFLTLIAVTPAQKTLAAEISGQSRIWHKVTLTFDGPRTSEDADPNPFLDYRQHPA